LKMMTISGASHEAFAACCARDGGFDSDPEEPGGVRTGGAGGTSEPMTHLLEIPIRVARRSGVQRRHLPCFHSRDACDLARAISEAPIGANTRSIETPEIALQPDIRATITGIRPTASITVPAMNMGLRKAFRVTG